MSGCGGSCSCCGGGCDSGAPEYGSFVGFDRIPAFDVVGVSEIISSKEQAEGAIGALWKSFFEKMDGLDLGDIREDDLTYAVYSDYEGDYTQPYRLTIGYKVSVDSKDPEGLFRSHVQLDDYALLQARGEQPKALVEAWETVWKSDLDRYYKSDFEVYGPRFFEEDGGGEVLVAVGVRV